MSSDKWMVSREEQNLYIRELEKHLVFLRTTAGISQAELAGLIGISRQTYSAIERCRKEMSWSVYLSLILFFDYHAGTHELLRSLPAFPAQIIRRINEGVVLEETYSEKPAHELDDILGELDERGRSIFRTMLQIEYARCKGPEKDQKE